MVINLFKYLFYFGKTAKSAFPESDLKKIEEAIANSEINHRAEICFACETKLGFWDYLKSVNSRERALQVFSDMKVWDTIENNGLLIYILLAERKVEIILDRKIIEQTSQEEWLRITKDMEKGLAKKDYLKSVVFALEEASLVLEKCFPVRMDNPNELEDLVKVFD